MYCIYCKKSNLEVSFLGREHVIPQLMGVFDNNPTLKKSVCDICNSKVFSPLEIKFKEDTEEGIRLQMLNLSDSSQVRIKAENVTRTITKGLKEKMFDEMFPFLNLQDGVFKVVLIPQIKIKHYGPNGYVVLLHEKVKDMDRNSQKFLSLKKLLGRADAKSVSIFVGHNGDGGDEELDKAKLFVKDLGIKYTENKRVSVDNEEIKGTYYETEMECRVDNEVGRVVAKIAFNYFAYCAIEDRNKNVLLHPNFNKIRDYITGTVDFPIKEIIPSIQVEPIIYDEKISNTRLLGHMITFHQENNLLISEVSFLGGKIYRVILGEIPDEIKNKGCGCGHIFDPINHKITQLTQNQAKWGSNLKEGFGLFKLT